MQSVTAGLAGELVGSLRRGSLTSVSQTFAALRIPNYRLWASGAIVSNAGTWMQRVAQDWLVLTVLTNDSGLAVGITTGLQFAPALLLAPVAGTVADRFDRRRVLQATQLCSGATALALGLLVHSGGARLWMVYVLAGLFGVAAAIDAPARQAFVGELVPREVMSNAVGLNSASFHAGRLIGPGVAGLLIHWLGTGPVFLLNAASYGAVLLSLSRMRLSELYPSPRAPRGRGAVRAGLRYVRGRPDLVLVIAMIGTIGTFSLNFQITTALMARLEFHKGAGEYGLLGSVLAIGSLTGALLAARRSRPTLQVVIGAAFVFGVFSIAAALMPTYLTFALSLPFVGVAALTLMTTANATVQVTTDPVMRGRVMALYMAVFFGGAPLGSPILGWIGERFGARWTILLGGGVAVLTAVAALARVISDRQAFVAPVTDPDGLPMEGEPAHLAVEGEMLDLAAGSGATPHARRVRRQAARVVLLDPDGRVLLMRAFDPAEPGIRFWFTVGGGLDPGEGVVDGALRELHEETGLRLTAADLRGPVHHEDVEFGYGDYWVTQSQEFFVASAPPGWQPVPAALEQGEIDTVDAWSWWSREQLVAHAAGLAHDGPGEPDERVYPAVLAELLARLPALPAQLPAPLSQPSDLAR